ncbi:helix-turn-helix domain-containing protein [Streptomyces sp. ISL-14]|nr:helix-turn-helix domain-containing protein [Streptomyces sp. ISL-14]
MLRETLIAWAECGFQLVRTADRLATHRNTLLYRLTKIEELAGRRGAGAADGDGAVPGLPGRRSPAPRFSTAPFHPIDTYSRVALIDHRSFVT